MKNYLLTLLLTTACSAPAPNHFLTTPGYGRLAQPVTKPSFTPPTMAPTPEPPRREHHSSCCHFDADKRIDLYLTLH